MGIHNIDHLKPDGGKAKMIVSPDILRREMISLLNMIDAQITEVQKFADAKGIKPEEVKNADGSWAMNPLLLAKVQAVQTLALLNQPQGK